jgi:hypothetical protein
MSLITTVPCTENRHTFGHNLPCVFQQSATRYSIWTQPSIRLPAVGHQTQQTVLTHLQNVWLYVFHVQYADIHGLTLLNQAEVAYTRKQSACLYTWRIYIKTTVSLPKVRQHGLFLIRHIAYDVPPSKMVRNSPKIQHTVCVALYGRLLLTFQHGC